MSEPVDQPVLVLAGELAKAEQLPDLVGWRSECSSAPSIRVKFTGRDLDLPREVRKRIGRDLVDYIREPAMQFEDLQQRRKAEPVQTRHVSDQPPILLNECPRLNEFIR